MWEGGGGCMHHTHTCKIPVIPSTGVKSRMKRDEYTARLLRAYGKCICSYKRVCCMHHASMCPYVRVRM